MREIAIDGLVELLAAVGYVVGTVVLTALGIEAELFGVQTLGTDPALAAWFLAAGGLALYVGLYQFGYERLVPLVAGRPE